MVQKQISSPTYGTPKHVNSGVTDPPTKITDPMTIRLVVVKNVCLAFDMVLRIAKAKAIAPRIPKIIISVHKTIGHKH